MGMGKAGQPIEVIGLGPAGLAVGPHFHPGLEHADVPDLLQHPEPFQDRQVHGQEGFADMKSGMVVLFQEGDLPALFRQQAGDGRTAGTPTDDQNITDPGFLVGLRARGLSGFS
jgi:hypothetical protein